jgi:2,3-dimethylmalate lyase
MTKASELRRLVGQDGILVTPGAYDCLSARMVEQAGFPIVAVTGAGVTASALGTPDLGLLGMHEMRERVERIVDAVDRPVIADAETGFGGVLNVHRTVHDFQKAGVAGLFLEDQIQERRCGHFRNKAVISTEDMVTKLRAALKARGDGDLFIMARTDAREIEGLDAAIERAKAYANAGVDSLFVEAPKSEEELEIIADRLSPLGLALKANMAEGGKTPMVSVDRLGKMGYKFAHFPGGCQKVAVKAMGRFLEDLDREGNIDNFYPDHMASLAERSEVLGLDDYYAFEEELT